MESLPESAFVFAAGQHNVGYVVRRDVSFEEAGAAVGFRTADGIFIWAQVIDEEWFLDLEQDPGSDIPSRSNPVWSGTV